ncbi:guanine nucleotide exchange protein smcr8b-like [Schistocerca piceifrons]|uniref:guanine nucleotide exchange protein smcr8b-like n=1 Tax=Schistocerca piceifrons TaxID=274613 RepID=UPI001F5E650F|nr:guanine nucleotide exchange protein smcr8b-like [Schistocerca piceifrons]
MAEIHADPVAFGYKAYFENSKMHISHEMICEENKEQHMFNPDEECYCTKEDFIVFAEFSEVMGPVPLLTFPLAIKDDPKIDVNTLILKIMSVDYHATPSGQFTFCEDVQVLQADVVPGLHAYVHYCTLHDLGARGFVRPLCFAYLSTDLIKVQSLFPTLREQFLKATEILQFNNRQWFVEELLRMMTTLKEKQNIYFSLKQKEEEGIELSSDEERILNSSSIDQLVSQYTEYKNMLHVAEPYMNNQTAQEVVNVWKGSLVSAEMMHTGVSRYMAKLRHELLNHGITSAQHNGPSLRAVVALSPWGLAFLLWELMCIQRQHRRCRLSKMVYMFAQDEELLTEGIQKHSSERALHEPEYLSLLSALTYPVDKPDSNHKRCSQDSLDFLEASAVVSGNEGSSSYHSAPESVSDIVIKKQRSSSSSNSESNGSSQPSCESYVDVSEPDSWAESESPLQHLDSDQQKLFMFCVWDSSRNQLPNGLPGKNLLKFFKSFPKAAHHVLYSILIGRTVVLAGSEAMEKKVNKIIDALVVLFPVKFEEVVRILRWHRGILVSSHINSYQLIGVCVPERISVHDMISCRDKNMVTILDITKEQLFGPAYSGQFLSSLEISPQFFQSDQTLILFLQSIAAEILQKLFLFRMSFVSPVGDSRNADRSPGDILREMGVHGCDAEIIKYLFKIGISETS